MNTNNFTFFSDADIKDFEPEMKIGLLATINDEGLPHITLISSFRANSPHQLIWGQFTEGLSKKFIRQRPETAFLVMNLQKEIWRGTAKYTHDAQTGTEIEIFNNQPMFRYNAYFGIHTVYYMDLIAHSGKTPLPMSKIVFSAIQTLAAKTIHRMQNHAIVMNPWTINLMKQLDSLKFISYITSNGYPTIIPIIQAQPSGYDKIIFSSSAYSQELQEIPSGTNVAIFGLSLNMTNVLMRGTFTGISRIVGVNCGSVNLHWVYNPMPPKPQQIYPEILLEPVTKF